MNQNFHEFEINLLPNPSSDFYVKMDGKKIVGIRDVKINCSLLDVPTITLEILARKISGKVQGKPKIVFHEDIGE